ncbi:MAG: hypothetical protein K8I30_02915, partial [Anaerolineae bacterium]|nr:hypothetical protein [Anaerolineae bacterium]
IMSRNKLLLLFAAFVLGVSSINAQDSAPHNENFPLVTIPNTESHSMSSASTGLEYQIFVALPEDYATISSDTRYSVVYLLDANFYFGAITEFIRVENLLEELPKLIVVGIGYPEVPLEMRVTDMERNPDRFLEFIADELIPFIDERYRTAATSGERTIMGHSLGGQFVLYTLFNRPELFSRYVAASPSWNEIIPDEADFASEDASLRVALFMSASEEETGQIEPVFTNIQNRQFGGLEATFLSVENATHVSSSIPAFTYGLRYVYQQIPAAS